MKLLIRSYKKVGDKGKFQSITSHKSTREVEV